MRLKNSDLVLFSVHELMKDEFRKWNHTTGEISSTLNIKEKTLGMYLSKLASEGYITRTRRPVEDEYILGRIKITDRGNQRIQMILEELKDSYFTPERHMIPACMRFMDIYNRFNLPLERIFLMNIFMKMNSFDLTEYLENINSCRRTFSITGYFRELDRQESPERPYEMEIFNMTLYGKDAYDLADSKKRSEEDTNSLLIHAETLMKQGKLEYSEMILKKLLEGGQNISRNQWFQIIQNLASVHMKKGEYDQSRKIIEMAEESTKDKLYLACLNYLRGTLLTNEGRYDEGISILSSSIRALNNFEIPILLSSAYNNRGVIYFIKGRFDEAEKDWLKAIKFARKANSKYVEVTMLINLADIEMMRGNYSKARKNLEEGYDFYEKSNILEKLAVIEFNYALLEIEMRNFEKAYEHFLRSEEVAFPLPGPWDRKIIREEIIKRAREKGYPEMEKLITGNGSGEMAADKCD